MLMTQWAVAGKGKSKTETDLRIVRIVTIHGKGKWGGGRSNIVLRRKEEVEGGKGGAP